MNTAKNILITPGGLGGFNTTISQIDFKWNESGTGTGIAYPHSADLRSTVYNWFVGTEPVLLFGGIGTVNGQSYFIGPYLDYTDVFTGVNSFPFIQIFPISGKIITKNFVITGSFYDSKNSIGLAGSILTSIGTGVIWTPPVILNNRIIIGSFSTNQVLYGVGTEVGGSNNLWFTGTMLGVGTSSPTQILDINGNTRLRAAIYDGFNTSGKIGQVLTSTGTGVAWSAVTQSLIGSLSQNQVAFGTSGGILTGSNNLIFTGSKFGIGTSSPSQLLSVWGTSFIGNGVAVSFLNNSVFDASSLVNPGQGFIGVYHYGTFWQGNGIAFNSQILGNKVLGMVVNANTMYFGSATDNIDFLTLNTSQSNFLDNNSYNILSINAAQGTVIQNSNTNDQKSLTITKNDTLITSSINFIGISTITLPINCMLTIEGAANGWASTLFHEGGTFMTSFYNNGSGAIKIGGSTNIFSKFTGVGGNFDVIGIGNTVYVVVKSTPGLSWLWRSSYKCLISQNY